MMTDDDPDLANERLLSASRSQFTTSIFCVQSKVLFNENSIKLWEAYIVCGDAKSTVQPSSTQK